MVSSPAALTSASGTACADRPPGDQVGGVLRRDGIEEFGGAGHAQLVHFPQQLARQAQAVVDAEAAIEARVVDQALPAHRRARLLKVHTHDDQQVVLIALAGGEQPLGVLHRRVIVVYRTGADHHHQPVIGTMQHSVGGLTRGPGGLGRLIAGGELAQDMGGR